MLVVMQNYYNIIHRLMYYTGIIYNVHVCTCTGIYMYIHVSLQ